MSRTGASCRAIAMLNQKGGVGKTTSTVNLGAALAIAGQRVLLLDLDPQAHLTLHLGIDAERVDRTVYDLLLDEDCPADEVIVNTRENLDAIIAETDLAAAETELAGVDGREGILRRKLMPLRDRYDVILIDCPPSLGLLTLNALALAEEVFVPMQAHFLALQGVGKLLETVSLVSRSVNPDLLVSGIILCMHEGQTTLAREVVSDLDAFFDEAAGSDLPWRDCRVLRPPIRRNIKLAEAPSFGQTIFDYEPWCAGALDYKALARRLIRHWGEVQIPRVRETPAAVVAEDPETMDTPDGPVGDAPVMDPVDEVDPPEVVVDDESHRPEIETFESDLPDVRTPSSPNGSPDPVASRSADADSHV